MKKCKRVVFANSDPDSRILKKINEVHTLLILVDSSLKLSCVTATELQALSQSPVLAFLK